LHSEGRGREFESRRARQEINSLGKRFNLGRGRSYPIATKRFALPVIHTARNNKVWNVRFSVEPTALEI
jgi:hypothetical protein